MNKVELVSVAMITYNHEQFIREAIEGVLMQQCNFNVELIVANDCSPDNTEQIINDFTINHPNGNWIKYTRHQANKGMMPNFIWALQQCQGKYIALCEGDDYWTDPLKLQKQVDFLEANEEYNGVFHKTAILKNSTNELSECILNKTTPDTIETTNLLKGNIIRTCSVALRIAAIQPLFTENKYVKVYLDSTPGDWLIFLFAIKNSKMKYLPETMAVYRIHHGGIWSEAKDIETKYAPQLFNGYVLLKKILPHKHFKLIFNRYAYFLGFFAEQNKQENKYLRYFYYKIILYFELLKMKLLSLSDS